MTNDNEQNSATQEQAEVGENGVGVDSDVDKQEALAAQSLVALESELGKTEVEAHKQELWDRATFFIVEDDLDYPEEIAKAINEQLSGEEEEFQLAESFSDVVEKIPGLVESSAGGMLVVIEDLEIPTETDGMDTSRAGGMRSIDTINNAVQTWNENNPDKQVDLRIIINSSIAGGSSFDDIPNVVGVADSKNKVVGAIDRNFEANILAEEGSEE